MNYKTITTLLLVLCISFCNAQKPDSSLYVFRQLHDNVEKLAIYESPVNYEYLDSVKAKNDSTIIYYYNPRIWKARYYALLKMRDYGYFRIPIHNRHKFRKAEKEYRELMK